jgi:hypothetical protein
LFTEQSIQHIQGVIKEIYFAEGSMVLKSDGILYVKLLKDQILDVPLQLRLLEMYKKITSDKLTPILFEGEEGIIVTKEARNNAGKLEEESPCKAMAVVANNIAEVLVANFYFKFNKPKRPYKVFKNREDGIQWLKNYV